MDGEESMNPTLSEAMRGTRPATVTFDSLTPELEQCLKAEGYTILSADKDGLNLPYKVWLASERDDVPDVTIRLVMPQELARLALLQVR